MAPADETPRVTARTRTERTALLRGVYLIVNEDARVLELAKAGLEAGIRIVQYRAKNGIVADRLRALRDMTYARDALLIVNDDWKAALSFDCDGVHLGPDDDGFARAESIRSALGERLVGLSCGTVEEASAAGASHADYIGVGPVYPTHSKPDAGDAIGIDGLKRVAAATSLPVAAIGGITADNLAEVEATGVAMAAVVSAVSGAEDPLEAALSLVETWGSRGFA